MSSLWKLNGPTNAYLNGLMWCAYLLFIRLCIINKNYFISREYIDITINILSVVLRYDARRLIIIHPQTRLQHHLCSHLFIFFHSFMRYVTRADETHIIYLFHTIHAHKSENVRAFSILHVVHLLHLHMYLSTRYYNANALAQVYLFACSTKARAPIELPDISPPHYGWHPHFFFNVCGGRMMWVCVCILQTAIQQPSRTKSLCTIAKILLNIYEFVRVGCVWLYLLWWWWWLVGWLVCEIGTQKAHLSHTRGRVCTVSGYRSNTYIHTYICMLAYLYAYIFLLSARNRWTLAFVHLVNWTLHIYTWGWGCKSSRRHHRAWNI